MSLLTLLDTQEDFYSSIFGALITRGDVERAAIAHLQVWLRTYLAERERQQGLSPGSIRRPPDLTLSYRGGIDFESVEESWLPATICVAQPFGAVERMGSGENGQWFEIRIAALAVAEDEDAARTLADHYGAAVMGAMVQRGDLGGLAERTLMTNSPAVEFYDPSVRRLAISVGTYQSFVTPVVSEEMGPAVPEPSDSSLYGGSDEAPFDFWATVETTSVGVTGVPLA